jgi:hypothetical protein
METLVPIWRSWKWAGYLSMRKAFVHRKPQTFICLSHPGRLAFEDYLEALRAVIAISPLTAPTLFYYLTY